MENRNWKKDSRKTPPLHEANPQGSRPGRDRSGGPPKGVFGISGHPPMLASRRNVALRFSTQSPMARANKLLDQILRGGADAHPVFRHGTTSEAARVSGAHQGQPLHIFPRRSRRNPQLATSLREMQTVPGETGPECYN